MHLPNFPIDKAYLIADWLASAFWGAFTMLMCVWGVSFFRTRQKIHVTFPLAIIFMYTLATVHISFILARLIQAFIINVDKEGGAILYLANIGDPLNRAKDMVYISIIICGDSIIVWRCFLVWNKNYFVVAIPFCMVLGTAIGGYGAVGQYFLPNPRVPRTVHWAQGMLSLSMVTNVLVTGLTAGKIWYISRTLDAKYFGPSLHRYRSIILLTVESGVFMAISKIIEFTLFQIAPEDGLNGLNALYIPLECMPQIMGICPTFIMLAVSTGLTTSGTRAHTSNGTYGDNSGQMNIAPITLAGRDREIETEFTVSIQTDAETQKYSTLAANRV